MSSNIKPDDLFFPLYDEVQDYQHGITKREYFAALALQGWSACDKLNPIEISRAAVETADELIKALNAETDNGE